MGVKIGQLQIACDVLIIWLLTVHHVNYVFDMFDALPMESFNIDSFKE